MISFKVFHLSIIALLSTMGEVTPAAVNKEPTKSASTLEIRSLGDEVSSLLKSIIEDASNIGTSNFKISSAEASHVEASGAVRSGALQDLQLQGALTQQVQVDLELSDKKKLEHPYRCKTPPLYQIQFTMREKNFQDGSTSPSLTGFVYIDSYNKRILIKKSGRYTIYELTDLANELGYEYTTEDGSSYKCRTYPLSDHLKLLMHGLLISGVSAANDSWTFVVPHQHATIVVEVQADSEKCTLAKVSARIFKKEDDNQPRRVVIYEALETTDKVDSTVFELPLACQQKAADPSHRCKTPPLYEIQFTMRENFFHEGATSTSTTGVAYMDNSNEKILYKISGNYTTYELKDLAEELDYSYSTEDGSGNYYCIIQPLSDHLKLLIRGLLISGESAENEPWSFVVPFSNGSIVVKMQADGEKCTLAKVSATIFGQDGDKQPLSELIYEAIETTDDVDIAVLELPSLCQEPATDFQAPIESTSPLTTATEEPQHTTTPQTEPSSSIICASFSIGQPKEDIKCPSGYCTMISTFVDNPVKATPYYGGCWENFAKCRTGLCEQLANEALPGIGGSNLFFSCCCNEHECNRNPTVVLQS